MSKNSNIVEYYRARAREYEQIYYRKVPERRQEIDDHCRHLERIARDKAVLDLACGTGYWTKVASNTAQKVIGTDIVIEMIEQSRTKVFGCPVEFVVADLHELPFKPGSFDLVTLGFWLSHEPKQNFPKLFDAITTPLKKNGLIWMIDNNPPAEGPRSDSAGADEHGNNFKKRQLQNGNEFVILKNYFSKEKLAEIFTPKFEIKELIHRPYYWSALLRPR
jgi:ubiquinone/menaquinone biosynthesis C-methylase UbiE